MKAAARLRRIDHAQESLVLRSREGDIFLTLLVRDAEVRKNALHIESRQLKRRQNVLQALVKMLFIA